MMRLLAIAFGVCALFVTPTVAADDTKVDCPEFEKHKCAKIRGLLPTRERKICIRVEVEGTQKVTYHFRRPDRSYYRPDDPPARIVNKVKSIWFAQSRFKKVLQDGGSLKICAGEKGEHGVVFEKEDIIRHLGHGPKCVETIRLIGGVYPQTEPEPAP